MTGAAASDLGTQQSGVKQSVLQYERMQSLHTAATETTALEWLGRLRLYPAVLLFLFNSSLKHVLPRGLHRTLIHIKAKEDSQQLSCPVAVEFVEAGSLRALSLQQFEANGEPSLWKHVQQAAYMGAWLQKNRLDVLGDLEIASLESGHIDQFWSSQQRFCSPKLAPQLSSISAWPVLWSQGMLAVITCSVDVMTQLRSAANLVATIHAYEQETGSPRTHTTLLIASPRGGCKWMNGVSSATSSYSLGLREFDAVQQFQNIQVPPRCIACLRTAALRASPYYQTLAFSCDICTNISLQLVARNWVAQHLGDDFDLAGFKCSIRTAHSDEPSQAVIAQVFGHPCIDPAVLVFKQTPKLLTLFERWAKTALEQHIFLESGFFARAPGIPENAPRHTGEWLATDSRFHLAQSLGEVAGVRLEVPQDDINGTTPSVGSKLGDDTCATAKDTAKCWVVVVLDATQVLLWKDSHVWQIVNPDLQLDEFWEADAVRHVLGGKACLFRLRGKVQHYNAWFLRTLYEMQDYAPKARIWIFEAYTHDIGLEVMHARRYSQPHAFPEKLIGFTSHITESGLDAQYPTYLLPYCQLYYTFETDSHRRLEDASLMLRLPIPVVWGWLYPRYGFSVLWHRCFSGGACGERPSTSCLDLAAVEVPKLYVFTGGTGWSRDFQAAIEATRGLVALRIATFGRNESLDAQCLGHGQCEILRDINRETYLRYMQNAAATLLPVMPGPGRSGWGTTTLVESRFSPSPLVVPPLPYLQSYVMHGQDALVAPGFEASDYRSVLEPLLRNHTLRVALRRGALWAASRHGLPGCIAQIFAQKLALTNTGTLGVP